MATSGDFCVATDIRQLIQLSIYGTAMPTLLELSPTSSLMVA